MIYPTLSFRAQRGICFFFSASSVPSVLNLCSFLCFRACLLNPSQLLRLFLLDQTVSPPRYSLQRQRPQSDAFQFFQRVLFLEQHAPQLFLLRIPHAHFIPIIRRPSARSIRLPHRLHLHANFFSQTLQVHECQHAFHFHLIDLFQLRPLVQHFRRQVAFIRQKYQPRRRILQIPHRKHALRQTAQTIAQRLPPFRVGHRRHHFRRLVQHHVNAPSCVRFDNFPRRLNPVLRRVRLRSSSFTTRPFTRTCPLAISSSACRREAIPARAIIFCNLSCMVSFLQSLVGARYIVPFFRLASTLCLSCGCFFVFSLHPYFATALARLFIPPPPLPSALCRSPPPASPHYSPPSLPAILPALPSPRGSRSRSRHSAPALRFLRSPLATRHSPLPPYRSRALPSPAPQTPSSP